MTEAFLVSGGGGGVGAAVCRSLANAGYIPIVGYHSTSTIAETIAEETGGRTIHLDLTDQNTINLTVETLTDEPLAGVVLAASPPPVIGPFGRIEDEDMRLQWEVNVVGPQRLCAGLIKGCFRKRKKGTVIGILTAAMGTPSQGATGNMGAYVIAKYGLQGLLAALKGEFPWLTTASLSPGYINTPMLEAFDKRFIEIVRQNQNITSPEEIAEDILALIRMEWS
ncbi:MAG: hypothetical protein A2516_08685 [Alphaproteobacteria bacterium RIFOXYD12_FULL_60_8]|nr:MAG: hypothetical protein A2516_08685 [Alphaproteobacteria bacterium RIFOXYD12_FULL_60_8]